MILNLFHQFWKLHYFIGFFSLPIWQADKQFEWGIYPDKNHGIYGGNTRLHLYKKMTNFIERSLGEN